MKKPVYLDYAAATPVDSQVLKAMQPYFSEQFFNPSALYLAGRDVRRALNEARDSVASELAVRSSEIIFTAGASESNNLAIRGVMDKFPGKKMLISSIEHESVFEPSKLYNSQTLKVDDCGLVDLNDLSAKVDDSTVLISIIYANNEIGTIQDMRKIAEIVRAKKRDREKRGVALPLYFHTDATQATLFLNISPKVLGVDLMTINGGKIYGPKQSGVLFVQSGIDLEPIIYGGGQERNLRSGTENISGVVGLATALTLARKLAKDESERLANLSNDLRSKLENIKGELVFHGHSKKRLPNHLSFAVDGYDNERLMMELDELGFMVATGSACSASSEEPSHVLTAIGVSGDMAQSTIRITLGRDSNQSDIENFANTLSKLIN